MMCNYLILLFTIITSSLGLAQQTYSSEAYIVPFKNNALGAYTIIHDDFGAYWARGIEEYADTMTYNRNIPICFAAITKECGKKDWAKANELIAHHHQIMNHSMSHQCGIKESWCEAGDWDEHHFNEEIDSSTAWIQKNTGKHPAFFIFPFDLFTDSMLTYLEAKGYLGARAGQQNLTHPANQLTPFRLNFEVYRPEHHVSMLDSFVQVAINDRAWGIRVLHGVSDDSWGKVDHVDYGKHLDHIGKLSKEHKLWIATLSDVVTYQYLRAKYSVEITKRNASGNITNIKFIDHPSIVLPDESLLTDKSLTLVIRQNSKSIKKITQDQQSLPFEIRDGAILINVRPDKKEIVITY